MALIDVDSLRAYLREEYGTAMMGGFPAAMVDLAQIEGMGGEGLCRWAEAAGVDLRRFVVGP